MEILEFNDVLSSVKIEEIKKHFGSFIQIAFGKFINGHCCVYKHVTQEELKEKGEMEFIASYIINKNGAFLNFSVDSSCDKKVTICETDKSYGFGPMKLRRVFTFSSENDNVDVDSFFENIRDYKFYYTDYIISYSSDEDEDVCSVYKLECNSKLQKIYLGNLDGVTNYAFNDRFLFLKTKNEDCINPYEECDMDCEDYDIDDYFDCIDDWKTILNRETQKSIYAIKYGIFDLKAKKHLIFAGGQTSFTNSANGFPNIRICKDTISFCSKLISTELINEPMQDKNMVQRMFTKKVWDSFKPLDNRSYGVEILRPFSSLNKNIFYTNCYFSFCEYYENDFLGKDYCTENERVAFNLYFEKPTPCVVVDLREYTSEAEDSKDFFGRVIRKAPGIFYTISQGKYTGMNIFWMLRNCPEKIIELINFGYLYLLNFNEFMRKFEIYIEKNDDEDYEKKIKKALSLAISYRVVENMNDHLVPLLAFSSYFKPECIECNSNKTFETLVLFNNSFIVELLQKHSLYVDPHVIDDMKRKYKGRKMVITIINKIEKENNLSTDFLNKEKKKLKEQFDNWSEECLYNDEVDFYENDTTWYDGDADAQWNID